MVAVQLKSEGRSKAQVRDLINQIFTHGCHCGWNYRRRKILDFFELTLVHQFVDRNTAFPIRYIGVNLKLSDNLRFQTN